MNLVQELEKELKDWKYQLQIFIVKHPAVIGGAVNECEFRCILDKIYHLTITLQEVKRVLKTS